jgi:site-specific DNA-methyltransferase (adenine-specific)
MRPYYSDSLVTIYHGDCREVLPDLLAGDSRGVAMVSDPPYGTGWVRGGGSVGVFKAKQERPEWDVWSTDWLHLCPRVSRWAIFAPLSRQADLQAALAGSAVVHWRKTNPRPNGPDRDAIIVAPAFLPAGIEYRAYNGDTPLHPCQKPLDLMQWVLGFIPPDFVIVDPFAGSGTTLEAAKSLGIPAVGIEENPEYCEVAAERCRQETLFGEVA